jgi:hypothetical protein
MAQLNIQGLKDLSDLRFPDNFQRLITAAYLREYNNSSLLSLVNAYDKIPYIAYNAGTTYVNGDVVLYQDKLFKKVSSAPAGTTPVEGANWEQVEDPFATQLLIGMVRFATEAEVDAGTSETLAISPATLEHRLDGIEPVSYTGGNGVTVDNLNYLINFVGGTVTVNSLSFIVNLFPLLLATNNGHSINIEPSGNLNMRGDQVSITIGDDPAPANQILVQTASNGLEYQYPSTEFSYSFVQGTTIVEDLFINSIQLTVMNKSIGINTVEISINGGAYALVPIPSTIPASASVLIRITYNGGYNNGVVTFKGDKL